MYAKDDIDADLLLWVDDALSASMKELERKWPML